MARNAEKAMTTLARWRAAQVQEAGGQRERRPYLASECNDLPQAEKWRLQIVREIAKKVAQIQNDNGPYDEIFTKMNENELKIKVPKSTKIERTGKYDAIEDLCTCEGPLYNTGDQIQFELPRDQVKGPNTYTSNLKYSYKKCDGYPENKDKKIINITPSNCPAPVNIEKEIHPLKDVFILRIGKKLETKDKKTDLEIELVTPKFPSAKPLEMKQMSQQSSTGKLEEKSHKSDKKKPKKAKSKSNLKKDKKNKKAKKSKTKK